MKNPMDILGMLGVFGAVMDFQNPNAPIISDSERAERQARLDRLRTPETEEGRAKRLGLKKWDFQGVVVYAATRKKALKLLNKKLNQNEG